ncbi:UNVERIFIED_CONTAM: hypothetical protein K2H54_000536 [Gekko kuhli]
MNRAKRRHRNVSDKRIVSPVGAEQPLVLLMAPSVRVLRRKRFPPQSWHFYFSRCCLSSTADLAASFSVFQPSSYHIIVETNAGLKLQIQLAPMMQLFAIADQSVKGTVQGKYELLSSMEDYSVSELIRGRKLLAAETTESRS